MTIIRDLPLVLRQALLAGLLLAAAQDAAADDSPVSRQLNLDGRILAVPFSPIYCPADRSIPAIDNIVSTVEKILPENLRLLTLDFECGWIEAVSSGRSPDFPRYIAHLAPLNPDGTVTTFPGRRDVFLESVAAGLASAEGRQAVEEAHADVEKQALEELNRMVDGSASLGDMQMRPGLDSDAAGVYSGIVANIQYLGNVTTLACVSSVTLVKGVVAGLNVCREHGGPGTFELLMIETRSIAAALVEANDPEL